jgi:serine/threonine protein kinase
MHCPDSRDPGRNLLFGLLAFQNNFIDRDDLLGAFTTWVADKSRPMGEVLLDRGALTSSQHALLTGLVKEHLKLHGDDTRRSLAALSSIGSACRELAAIPDAELCASLAHVPMDRRDDDPFATRSCSTGEPTSAGSRFRILRFHARGGLGQVSVALDQELGREVALKEIQDRHADEPTSRARFRLEAEITGGLEHPGIVPVYGLGTEPTGRPFYAMRFIRGENLHEAIKRFHAADVPGRVPGERSLALRKLLGRFVDVCNAVAYAHSRGVLHRDLKPGNVMLGPYGETLVVDWGLAKVIKRATEAASDERPLQLSLESEVNETLAGCQVGTPGFMSPEQAEGRLDLLGPTSDVYSLGATLYALLTGHLALEERDPGAGRDTTVHGEIPPARRVNPMVPPALESICIKCMAHTLEDRYPTPRELGEDIEHWLADEPVSAHYEDWRARMARWSRRNRAWIRAGAASLMVGLLAAVTLAVQQSYAAYREGRIAARESAARQLAEFRLNQIQNSSDLLASIFRDLDPRAEEKEGKPLASILGERIVGVAEQLEDQSVSDPLTVAKLQDVLGTALVNLAHYEQAIALLAKAQLTQTALLGPDDPDTLTSRNDLAVAYYFTGRTADAIALYQETLKLRVANLGSDHPDTLTSRNDLAVAYAEVGRTAEAIQMHQETLELRAARLGPDHARTLESRNNLAVAYRRAGRWPEAIALHKETLERLMVRLGDDHALTILSRNNLAATYRDSGRTNDAIALHLETLKMLTAKLGPDHPDTLSSRNGLASAYRDAGRTTEAIQLLDETIKLGAARLAPDHPETLNSRMILASTYERLGRWREAATLSREMLSLVRKSVPPDSPLLASELAGLALDLLHLESWSEAEIVLRECLSIRVKAMADEWSRFNTTSQLGGALLGQSRYAEAEPLIVQGYEGLKARESIVPHEAMYLLSEAAERVVKLYEAWGKREQAAAWKVKLGMPDLPDNVFPGPE